MAKRKYRMGQIPDKKTQAEENKEENNSFVQKALDKRPGKKKPTPATKKEVKVEKDLSSSQQEDKSTSRLENKEATGTKEKKEIRAFEKTHKVGMTLMDSTVKGLRRMVNDFKEEFETKGPDRNHIVAVAVKRLKADLEGEDREVIVSELLALRELSRAKQSRKG